MCPSSMNKKAGPYSLAEELFRGSRSTPTRHNQSLHIKYFLLHSYQRVHTAPNVHPNITPPNAHTWPRPSPPKTLEPLSTPFGSAGNVVTNACVGFGAPLTVTVAALESGDGWLALGDTDAEGARIVKRGDVAYMIPCVELMKRRK